MRDWLSTERESIIYIDSDAEAPRHLNKTTLIEGDPSGSD